jgi:pyruvate dehydrogenase E2 component (dihydrolipoamide acetyltransferase)
MATEVTLPSLGEGVDAGDVLEILVSEGETVEKDQGLLELETDKATVTVPSPSAGKIVSIKVAEGDSVEVGSVIVTMEGAEASAAPEKTPEPPAEKEPEPKAEPAAETPVEKPAPPAPPANPVAQPPVNQPPVNQPPVAAPQPAPQAASPQAAEPIAPTHAAPPPVQSVPPSGAMIAAGPAIRRFAREVGVDLAAVAGTGEGGRITRDDVLAVVRASNQRPASPSADAGVPVNGNSANGNSATGTSSSGSSAATKTNRSGATPVAKPGTTAQDDYGPIRVERMSKIRKTIASQMHKSWDEVPRVTNFDDADITELEAFRQSSKEDYAARGLKLTTMPFLIKAIATSLMRHPAINATIDMENQQIIYKDYVNLGIAVDTDRGLVVPTIKNAHRMSIPDIAEALADLSSRVRENDFSMADLRGGSFTLSNLGAIGGTYSTPIVNVPEVAILLVGRSRKLPVVMPDDSIKPRLMMPLSIAYDHRLVDGATAARFLNDVIGFLEAPSRLLLAV